MNKSDMNEGDFAKEPFVVKTLRAKPTWIDTLIVCFFTGSALPPYVEAMDRNPSPAVGAPFGREFFDVYLSALQQNPAVHDGAVLVGRKSLSEDYVISGWSYRLFPPALGARSPTNRGSAYNSCLAMSVVDAIDFVCLISKMQLIEFKQGSVRQWDT